MTQHSPRDAARPLPSRSLSRALRPLLALLLSVCCALLLSAQASAKLNPLSLAPASSPYLINYEPNDRLKEIWSAYKDLEVPELVTEDDLKRERSSVKRFMGHLYMDVVKHSKSNTLHELGLNPLQETSYALYGLGIWPVLQVSVSNHKRLMTWVIKRAKASGLKLKAEGKRLIHSDERSGLEVSVNLHHKRWVSLSVTPSALSKELSPWLLGQNKPAQSLLTELPKLKGDMNVTTSSFMWVSFERLVTTLLGRAEGVAAAALLGPAAKLNSKVSPTCADEYQALIKHMPELIFGLSPTSTSTDVSMMTLWRTSPAISAALKGLHGEQVYELPKRDVFAAFTLSINVKGMLSAAQQLLAHLKVTPFTCPQLAQVTNPQMLTQLESKLLMLPPFVQQVRGLSVSIFNAKQPADAAIALSAESAPALINVLKTLAGPQAQAIELPAVGAPAQPLKGLPLPPSIGVVKAQLLEGALLLSVGERGEAAVKALSAKPAPQQSPLYSVTYNWSEMMSQLNAYLKQAQRAQRMIDHSQATQRALAEGKEPPPEPAEEASPLDLFEKMPSLTLTLESRATSAGLEMEGRYSIKAK